jgi:hypothetical protein
MYPLVERAGVAQTSYRRGVLVGSALEVPRGDICKTWTGAMDVNRRFEVNGRRTLHASSWSVSVRSLPRVAASSKTVAILGQKLCIQSGSSITLSYLVQTLAVHGSFSPTFSPHMFRCPKTIGNHASPTRQIGSTFRVYICLEPLVALIPCSACTSKLTSGRRQPQDHARRNHTRATYPMVWVSATRVTLTCLLTYYFWVSMYSLL